MTDGGTMSAQAAGGGGRARQRARREYRWARERTEAAAEMVTYLEEIEDKIGEGGGGGGGIVDDLIGSVTETAGDAAIEAGDTVAEMATDAVSTAVGNAVADAVTNNSLGVDKPSWVPLEVEDVSPIPVEQPTGGGDERNFLPGPDGSYRIPEPPWVPDLVDDLGGKKVRIEEPPGPIGYEPLPGPVEFEKLPGPVRFESLPGPVRFESLPGPVRIESPAEPYPVEDVGPIEVDVSVSATGDGSGGGTGGSGSTSDDGGDGEGGGNETWHDTIGDTIRDFPVVGPIAADAQENFGEIEPTHGRETVAPRRRGEDIYTEPYFPEGYDTDSNTSSGVSVGGSGPAVELTVEATSNADVTVDPQGLRDIEKAIDAVREAHEDNIDDLEGEIDDLRADLEDIEKELDDIASGR
ncbi:hypothetical protein [Halosimplex pelagicum]|uniref:Uncharacterized protein n=1 Tax=Halosimplex pelagicum TaxID=869886 RepID=A0A7D5P522_9EURY|nr:hypothetical protein [Halosimplex pelagicum]QLH80983.1 hypothetical protein HZS54_04735 [Halosimplex pelagicum]